MLPRIGKLQASKEAIQCPFQLINILFSDEFAGDFATLGNVASRQLLDEGVAGNNKYFWAQVQEALSVLTLCLIL